MEIFRNFCSRVICSVLIALYSITGGTERDFSFIQQLIFAKVVGILISTIFGASPDLAEMGKDSKVWKSEGGKAHQEKARQY